MPFKSVISSPDRAKKVSVDELRELVVRSGSVPGHIAFIMDGNGRWAKKRRLPRIAGHRKGVKTVRRLVEVAPLVGVDVMTFYTFSMENWRRPVLEVNALMELLLESINSEIEDLKRNDVSLRMIGDVNALPERPRIALERAVEETAGNKGVKLVLALSYSGRHEIVQAVNRIISEGITRVDEETFPRFLYTADLPDPDLLIRTSGELRLSNFLLYQLAYTEIIVTDKYWPEFGPRDLYECILDYQNRQRRFGKTSEQVENRS